jgi:nucleotide-binding universal stress UspA family protein
MNLAFQTIVVATDFSGPSKLALEYARVLAKRFDASLRVLHIVELPVVLGSEVPLPDLGALAERAVIEAQEELSRVLAGVDAREVIGQVLVGDPATQIVQYLGDHDADLLVMGTHGRGGLAHFLIGSVAERVVRTAPCPVFTIKETEALRCAAADAMAAAAS